MQVKRTRQYHLHLSEAAPGGWTAETEGGGGGLVVGGLNQDNHMI